MTGRLYETLTIDVDGGTLVAGAWGPPGAPVVLALHGITGNHLQFAYVAAELDDEYRIVAPDLRGRGASAAIAGPFGMEAHARDALALLDHVGATTCTVLGHSMGGYVATRLGWHNAERVERMVLVDGGIAAVPPPGVDLDVLLTAVLGPSIDRLSMRFASVDDYRAFWRAHPAFAADWTDVVEAAIDYEIVGTPPELHSSVSLEGVRLDAADTLRDDTRLAIERTACPIELVLAERGMFDQPEPVFPEGLVAPFRDALGDRLVDRRVEGVNHYTICLSERGAKEVATAVRG